eukprot:jgi/Mesen1/534/ME000104S10626
MLFLVRHALSTGYRSRCYSRAVSPTLSWETTKANVCRKILQQSFGTNAEQTSVRQLRDSGIFEFDKHIAKDELQRPLNLNQTTYMIWGANTDVGKTVISGGLVIGALELQNFAISCGQRRPSVDVLYLKPVQTGYPLDNDCTRVGTSLFDFAKALESVKPRGDQNRTSISWKLKLRHSDKCIPFKGQFHNATVSHQPGGDDDTTRSLSVTCSTLIGYERPVSPHLAAVGAVLTDSELREKTLDSLESHCREHRTNAARGASMDGKADEDRLPRECWAFVETAGGVASPGPSGSLQCDLYRPLRLPGVLVGDGHLGGISTTIAAYETLVARGYDVDAVLVIDQERNGELLRNAEALRAYFRERVPVFDFPPPPPQPASLDAWYREASGAGAEFARVVEALRGAHQRRLARLQGLPAVASGVLWWPFTQHDMVPTEDVTVIDSRCGGTFTVLRDSRASSAGELLLSPVGSAGDPRTELPRRASSQHRGKVEGAGGPGKGAAAAATAAGAQLAPQVDACASWWTQGPSAALQLELARAVGYAAARYGHVMFPENAHEPAVKCAELLLAGVGKGWADRVFYSDDGSTAIEVALKMAFRKYVRDLSLLPPPAPSAAADGDVHVSAPAAPDLRVIALAGSYHGDTLGAQEAQAPTVYTGFLQQPWYRGKGLFLVPPTVSFSSAGGSLVLPPEYADALDKQLPEGGQGGVTFRTMQDVFDLGRDRASPLKDVYRSVIGRHLASPVASGEYDGVHHAALILEPGGMELIDPLFQRTLVEECRERGIPVVFDEVFTGFWRLGVESAADLLGCKPDIACFAKLLTGGAVPLAVTLASSEVFDAFRGASKLDALLHGHSYTAHPVGCWAAVTALQSYQDPRLNPNFVPSQHRLRQLWDEALVEKIASLPAVKRVVPLGTLFVAELRTDAASSGYASTAARGIIQDLREDGVYARPLGNVIYFMCGPAASPDACGLLLRKLELRLLKMHAKAT